MSDLSLRPSRSRRATRLAVLAAVCTLAGRPGSAADPPLQPAAPEAAEPLTLRRALAIVVSSGDLAQAAAAAEAEAAAAARAASPTRPDLVVTSGPGYAAGLPVPAPSIASVQLHATLYDPARRAEQRQALAQAADAQDAARLARERAAREAGELYGRCLSNEELLAAAAERAAALAGARELTEALLGEGRVTALDLERARLREAEAQGALAEARDSQALDELALRRLLGWPDGRPLRLDPSSTRDLPGADLDAVQRALSSNPGLRTLDAAAAHLEAAARLRGRRLMPLVEGAAQYSRLYKTADWDLYYRGFQPGSWSVGALVTLPLWDGDRSRAEAARTRASLERAKAERRTRARTLEIDTRRALAAVAREASRAGLARQAEQLAQHALETSRALHAEGRVPAPEVAQRQAELADARAARARAEHESFLARLTLAILAGGLLEDLP